MQIGQIKIHRGTQDNSQADKPGKWLVEESNPAGTAWHTLPFPPGVNEVEVKSGDSCGSGDGEVPYRCKLLIGQLPDGGDMVFLLRARWVSELRHDLWVFDESAAQWRPIVTNLRAEELVTGKPIQLPIAGKKIFASTFHPHKVRLWTE
jgi:hypothetical protein